MTQVRKNESVLRFLLEKPRNYLFWKAMGRRTGGEDVTFMTIIFATITGEAELEIKPSWKKPKFLISF